MQPTKFWAGMCLADTGLISLGVCGAYSSTAYANKPGSGALVEGWPPSLTCRIQRCTLQRDARNAVAREDFGVGPVRDELVHRDYQAGRQR
jgi:hypothetical protein